jgi:O-succinylbenzoic acid--CoA ligase
VTPSSTNANRIGPSSLGTTEVIPDRLATSAFEAPEAPFLLSGRSVVTYGEADDRVARMAGGLAEAGIRAGDRVAVWGGNDVATSLCLLAVLRLGAVAVPINTRVTAEEARRQADVAGVALWVGSGGPVPGIPMEDLDGPHLAAGERPEREEALVVFTSGTTGSSKGVRLSRGALDASARASADFLSHRRSDRWLAVLPVFHVGGIQVLLRSALVGGSVRLVDRFEVGAVADAVRDCSLGSLVSPMLRRLLDADADPGALRAVLLGGGPIPPGLAEEAVAAGWPVLPTYGQTEASSQIATCPPSTPGRRAAKPLPGVEVDIDTSGEIVVRGPIMFTGYLGEPDRDPRAWHRTGDLGFLEDGRLRVVGRADDVIVTGGENVHPGPVEEALVAAGAAAAAVVGLADDEWGSEVVAAVVGADPGLLEARIRSELPGFAVPRRWVVVEELPVTALGKPDRAAIRSLFGR